MCNDIKNSFVALLQELMPVHSCFPRQINNFLSKKGYVFIPTTQTSTCLMENL